jgi:hypothetical protein
MTQRGFRPTGSRVLARLGATVAVLLLACATEPQAPPASPELVPEATAAPGEVSGAGAWAHLEALVDIGPRVSGTPGAERARAYVRQELEALGLVVEEIRGDFLSSTGTAVELVNLSAEIPGTGTGDGVFVLAAPMDTAPTRTFELVGANEGGSGTALLLELARAIQAEPLSQRVELLFFDGEVFSEGSPRLGSRMVAAEYARLGILDDIRLLVVIDQVADADLGIHRELISHRVYRDFFFRAADRLGYAKEFDRTAPFDQLDAAHVSFFDLGMRRVVALADVRYGGDEVPGAYWRTEDDDLAHCAPESLELTGRVVLAGLREVSKRQLRAEAHRQPRPQAEETKPPSAPVVEPPMDAGAEAAVGEAATDEAPSTP